LDKFDEMEKERDELKQKVEELEKQGGIGINDEHKNELERVADAVREGANMNDDELTKALN